MKPNIITVSFNNGSVPPQYAYRYQIVFSEQDEKAELKLFRGYDADEKIVIAEQRKFNTEIFLQLLALINKIETSAKDPATIGGSQRIIDVNSEKIIIRPDDDKGISLFNRFLYLYNPDFINQINHNLNL